MAQFSVFSLDMPEGDGYVEIGRRYRRGSCKRCMTRRKACDGNEPCAKCQQASVACEYGFIKRKPPTKRKPTPAKLPASSVMPSTNSGQSSTVLATQAQNGLAALDISSASTATKGAVRTTQRASKGKGKPETAARLNSAAFNHSKAPPVTLGALLSYLRATYQASDVHIAALMPRVPTVPLSRVNPKCEEEQIYHPLLVTSLMAVFVDRQIRLWSNLQLQRLHRKLRTGTLSPFTLNAILTLGASLARFNHNDLKTRMGAIKAYYDRVDALLPSELEHPSLECPFLLSLISGIAKVIRADEKFLYYSGLAKNLALQLNMHTVDSPSPTADAAPLVSAANALPALATPTPTQSHRPSPPEHWQQLSPAAADNELTKEFKRRVFWTIATYDNLLGCMLGLPPGLMTGTCRVKPIDDSLLEQLLRCDPRDDHYPAIIPDTSQILMGYPKILPFSALLSKVSHLRMQARDNPAMNIAPYHHLNRKLQAWYHSLTPPFTLPDQCPADSELAEHLVHYESIYLLHTTYVIVVILLNIGDLLPVQTSFQPAQDPWCHQWGLDASHLYTTRIFPFYQEVLKRYPSFNACFSILIPAFKLITSLPRMNPAECRAARATIDQYVEFLRKHADHVSANQAYVDLLLHSLAAVTAPGLQ
ncbi:hypothetical protein H4R34_002218 [Dimargaris verticillata]|uniref:Zn(2)-C6 fungal-type domain-containing protein n=1 Tax=Dimargaris verticillata TaxID=2761393 RepID=A0A9W8E9I1_9FUNG|nr:hypothetical protein H4R34_002218 [Dimargaris verticillata]